MFVRFEEQTRIAPVLYDLESRGIIRNARALRAYGWINRRPSIISSGTYRLHPGLTADEVFSALTRPMRPLVRIPETNWAKRTANLLEMKGVLEASEYVRLVESPHEFASLVDFKLPQDTLEGYLYPDTYELPPLLGAKQVILRQLEAFERKVWDGLGRPKNLHRTLTVASLVELEVMKDEERPIVAGVIENRLAKGMPLQIDAAVLYAQGRWGRLTFKDIRETISPYNTYLNKGLPPGPICSPTVKSVKAAMAPAKHPYLYYVALPDGRHLFSRTYEEHLSNIAKRRRALAQAARP
jgi:UPF0755 protein